MAGTLIVAPHPDDAVLSCWSVLAREQAGAVRVVVACAGLPAEGVLGAWDERCGAASSRVRMTDRRREEARSLAGCGAGLVLLDLLDWQYGPAGEDVGAALAPHLADASWVLAPAAIGGHRDHLRVRDAVLALRPDALLWADLPYALRHGFDAPLPGYDADERVLDAAELAAKARAVACHATQVPGLEAEFGPLLAGGALAREALFHRV